MADFDGPIPNSFRKFNNMTYSVSLYLQSHERYNAMMAGGPKDVTGLELLIQSGGASTDPGSGVSDLGPTRPASGNFGAVRNKYFKQDFYLDDIQLQSFIAGTSTGGPQNSFEFNFTVTEPNGLSFLNRLYNASVEYTENTSNIKNFNPVNQIYLAVIRFYGYDENGKQIQNGEFNTSSDPNAYVEKWIPFMLFDVKFTVESSKVVYACQGVCPQSQIGLGQVHGTLPFDVGLQGTNLKDLLEGTETKRAPSGAVTQGLMAALNHHQKKLASTAKDGTPQRYDEYDEYAIEFQNDAGLSDAVFSKFTTTPITRSGTASAASPAASTQASTRSAKSIQKVYTQAGNAGMKIVTFIDLAIRSSSYMTDQYKAINDAAKQDSTRKIPGKEEKPLNWFKIRPRVEVKAFDEKRAAWAYKITYVVTVYPVASVETNDFTSARCFKTHKEYDFWFTGRNTEVLNFSQEFNSFYITTFSAKYRSDPAKNPKGQNNARAQNYFRATSDEAHTAEGMTDEPSANAASVLYAPQDQANCEIDILGDPDWLSQSELFFAATKDPGLAVLQDGSINYDRAEVYFSVNFNTVVDYDLETGLADVTEKNVGKQLDGSFAGGLSQYAFVYRANTITTQFAAGKFTQQLKGTVVFIPEVCITGLNPASLANNDQNFALNASTFNQTPPADTFGFSVPKSTKVAGQDFLNPLNINSNTGFNNN